MAFDLQSIYIRDTVPVTSIEIAQDDPVVLQVLGREFGKVAAVEINNVEAAFTVTSTTELLVVLPDSLRDSPIETLNVFSNEPTLKTSSFFVFQLGTNPGLVTGPMKALMQFIKVMMTTPGSDTFDPSIGGNFQNWPGMKVDLNNPTTLLAKTVLMITSTATQIISRQRTQTLPSNEKLKSIDVLAIDFDRSDLSAVEVRLRVNTFGDNALVAGIVLGTNEVGA